MRYTRLAIPLLLGLYGLTSAHADGYAPGQAGYKVNVSETRYSARDDVRNYLTAAERRELKRIHARAVARRDGRVFDRNRLNRRELARHDRLEYRRPVARHESSRPSRIEPVRYRGERIVYVERDSASCRAPIEVTSEERGWRNRALGDARDKWISRAIANHGYRFGNLEKARNVRPDCNPIRRNKFGIQIWVCDFSARPCKDN